MPPQKRKLKRPDGREIDATVIPFQEGGEHWNEYLLQDGTVLRIKLVLSEVLRVDGQYDPSGDPAYVVKSQNIVSVSAPDGLRRRD